MSVRAFATPTSSRSSSPSSWSARGERICPGSILRPSIVVGDRASGWTAAFNVMYWPLRALSTGLFKAVPAMPESPLDIVSIDYVADAIHELAMARRRRIARSI